MQLDDLVLSSAGIVFSNHVELNGHVALFLFSLSTILELQLKISLLLKDKHTTED
jgi:hypothetical protein